MSDVTVSRARLEALERLAKLAQNYMREFPNQPKISTPAGFLYGAVKTLAAIEAREAAMPLCTPWYQGEKDSRWDHSTMLYDSNGRRRVTLDFVEDAPTVLSRINTPSRTPAEEAALVELVNAVTPLIGTDKGLVVFSGSSLYRAAKAVRAERKGSSHE